MLEADAIVTTLLDHRVISRTLHYGDRIELWGDDVPHDAAPFMVRTDWRVSPEAVRIVHVFWRSKNKT